MQKYKMVKQSRGLSKKLTITLSILAFLFSAFTFASEKDNDSNYIERKESIAESDSIKKASVPVAYLKLLEGEYVSTNDPNGVRKIKFVVEDGVLFGNDNGYQYILIPEGNGKFTNPDDGATLVFDTKNKNAITLLLFGTINLKKVK